jgi:hypothetical protein
MAEIKTATSSKEPFRVEQQPDGSFRIYGLTSQPLPITREQASAWLQWMENDGARKLRQLLKA